MGCYGSGPGLNEGCDGEEGRERHHHHRSLRR
jgi:hypothetical protein